MGAAVGGAIMMAQAPATLPDSMTVCRSVTCFCGSSLGSWIRTS